MKKRKIKKRRSFQRDENPEKMLKQMSRDHLEVLHSIESTIVHTCRDHEQIDDKTTALALKSIINSSEPEEPLVDVLVKELAISRQANASVPDDIWIKGLKVVLFSVNNHSSKKPGEKAYLNFTKGFMQ